MSERWKTASQLDAAFSLTEFSRTDDPTAGETRFTTLMDEGFFFLLNKLLAKQLTDFYLRVNI